MVSKGSGSRGNKVGCPKGGQDGNKWSKQYNSAFGVASENTYKAFPGSASGGPNAGIWIARLEGKSNDKRQDSKAVCNELRDPLNLDFRPRRNSALVNKGAQKGLQELREASNYWKNVKGGDYDGWAQWVKQNLGDEETDLQKHVWDGKPDIGAYEADPENYWIPGRQMQTHAGMPVPYDGAVSVAATADL